MSPGPEQARQDMETADPRYRSQHEQHVNDLKKDRQISWWIAGFIALVVALALTQI